MQNEGSYTCNACGEEIVVPLDLSEGLSQEYVEDCPVCCRPNVIHVEIDEDGEASVWAEANGVRPRALASWCAHSRRWQAQLEGTDPAPARSARRSGFVAARVAPNATSTSVRVELNAGGARLELHWPLAHARELAALLREFGQ